MKIREDSSGAPGSELATFTNPSSIVVGSNTFTAPSSTTLAASTTYWISVSEGVSSGRAQLDVLGDDSETGLTGWTIGNGRLFRNSEASSWTDGLSLKLAIRGFVNVGTNTVPLAPTLTAVPGNTQVQLNWVSGGDGGAAITSWEYHQGTSSTTTAPTSGWTAISGSGADTTSHTITGLSNGTQLFFRVRAVNGQGNGAASAEVSATPAAATVPSATTFWTMEGRFLSLNMGWVSGSDGGARIDRWEYRITTDGTLDTETWMAIPDSGAGEVNWSTFTVTGLASDTRVYVQIRAHNSVGYGAASSQKTVKILKSTAPLAPTLTATPGNTQVELTWTSGGDGRAPITSWEFHQSTSSSTTAPTSGWTAIAGSGADTTSHTITGLSNGTQLFFRVRAVNGEGDGAASAEVSATPTAVPVPLAPVGFSANERDSSVILDWVPGGDGGSPILRWEYRYSTDGGNSWDRDWTEIPNSAPGETNARNYTVTGLENGTQYRIEVRAVSSAGPGAASARRRFTPPGWPPAPTSLTATAGNRQVSLAWTPGSHSGWPITIWEYHQATSSSTNPPTTGWKWIPGSGPGGKYARSYTVTGLTSGTEYFFRVRAQNVRGAGAPSVVTSATPPVTKPLAPRRLTATAGNGRVKLAWLPGSNGGAVIDRFDYRYSTDGTLDTETWTQIPDSGRRGTNHIRFTVTGLMGSTTYLFEVRAHNSKGDGAASAVASAVTQATKPLAPTLTADPGNYKVSLTWVSGGEGDAPITEWQYRQTTGHTWYKDRIAWEDWTEIPDSGAATTSHWVTKRADDTALINSTTYLFQVRAVNANGEGDSSHTVYATPGAPAAPQRLTAAAAGNGQVKLTWVSGSDNGSGIHYWQYRRLDGAWRTIPLVEQVDVSTFSFTVTGLPNGTHSFQVRGVNFRGKGAASPVASATSRGRPSGRTLTAAAGKGEVTLTWRPGDYSASPVDRFEYRYSTDGALDGHAHVRLPGGGVTAFPENHGLPSADNETWKAIPDSAPGGANATRFTVTGLAKTRGIKHQFQVRSHNAVGDGVQNSPITTAMPWGVPWAPTLTATPGDGGGQVTLSWVFGRFGGGQLVDCSNGGGQLVDRSKRWHGGGQLVDCSKGGRTIDRIEYRLGNSAWTAIPDSAPGEANAASFTVTGLTYGTAYSFQVRAHNSVGDGDPSPVVSATPTGTAPLAPTLTATAGNRQVTLNWVSGGDGGAPIDRWEWSGNAGNNWRAFGTNAVSVENGIFKTNFTSLTNGTEYFFQVRAHNSVGDGDPSPVVSATPMAPPISGNAEPSNRPGRAVNLAASEADGAVTLTWDAPADGGAPSGYMILRRAPELSEGNLRTLSDNTGSAVTTHATTYTDTSVQPGVKYIYRVKALNGVGQGDPSRPAQIRTAAAAANNPPAFGSGTYAFPVSESATAGDMVGSVAATDSDAGDELAYAITAGNAAGKFAIGSADGQVTVAGALDYETAASYTLTLQVGDGNGGTATAAATITVADVNEAPVFNPGSYTFFIAESADIWTSIGRLTATDQDAGDAITYYITSGNADDRFMIDWNYGDILLMKELDYETTPSYTLTVEARDGNGGTATAAVVITGTQANGSPTANESPTFDTASYAFSTPEDTATGGSVGAVSASDPDEGQSVAYSISAGNDAGKFSINAGTGEVAVASALDYETASSYTLTVQAGDGNGGTDTASVVVTVTKVNSPPEFGSGTYAFPVSESAPAGDVVGSVAATDSDAGDELSYTITAGNAAGKFAIGSADGQVTVAGALDHETAASYTLTVQAGDGNGGTDTATVVVTVTKVNSPPAFSSGTYAFTVSESATAGDVVGSVAATDSDAGDELSYTITAGNAAGKFAMGSADGRVTVAGTLDYATAASHTLTVQAGDGNGGTDTATVVVTVTKVNSPPEFGSETYAFTVSDGATAGDVVGSVAATDSDAGDELSYAITAGNEAGKFAIGSADGQVTVAGALDYATAASYTLTVQAGDGNGGTATATVVITVTKANESPIFDTAGYAFSTPEDAATGGSVGAVSASDPDEGQSVAYSISAGNDAGKFSINAETGEISVASALDYETASSYTLTVQVRDGNGGTDTATVTITVTDVNEAPVFNPSSYTFSIAESVNTWTSIGQVTATDQDAGGTITYYITSGNADDRFAIDWNYGDILLMKELDYETAPSYTLTVEARDGNGGTATATVEINVTDVAE